jgi:hypothetical protein
VTRSVLRRLQGQVQAVADLRVEGETDDAARLLAHEVDDFGGDVLRRHAEVAFVLAGGVVHEDEHAAFADVVESVLDRGGHEGVILRIFALRGAR